MPQCIIMQTLETSDQPAYIYIVGLECSLLKSPICISEESVHKKSGKSGQSGALPGYIKVYGHTFRGRNSFIFILPPIKLGVNY